MAFIDDWKIVLNGVEYKRIKYNLSRNGEISYSVSLAKYGWGEVQNLIDAMEGRGLSVSGIRVTNSQELAEVFFADKSPKRVTITLTCVVDDGLIDENTLRNMLSHRDFRQFDILDCKIEDENTEYYPWFTTQK